MVVEKIYNDGRATALLAEAMGPEADWSVLGPELAYELQEARREITLWMRETRHATQISDAWKRRYIELVMTLEGDDTCL